MQHAQDLANRASENFEDVSEKYIKNKNKEKLVFYQKGEWHASARLNALHKETTHVCIYENWV